MATAAAKKPEERIVDETVRHLDGCPADRLEVYLADGPSGTQQVARCIECGESKVTPIENEEAA